MRRPVKPLQCTPVCLCRCAVFLSHASSSFSDWGAGGVAKIIQMTAVFLFSVYVLPRWCLTCVERKTEIGNMRQWGRCYCCGVRENGNSNRLDKSVSANQGESCWTETELTCWADIEKKVFHSTQCILNFQDMFLLRTGDLIVQSIMVCSPLLGHLLNEYYMSVLKQQGSLFFPRWMSDADSTVLGG